MAKQRKIIQVQERVPLSQGIPLSIQHTFAMFSASVLVPWLFGINASIVLLMNGIGTLIFIAVTKGKAPAYLGSSFAFLSPALLLINDPDFGYEYALGGFVMTGIIFCIVAGLIKLAGTSWIDVVLPPAAMGPVVALIGLELAGTAASNGGLILSDTYTAINPKFVAVFLITILVAVVGQVIFKGFAAAIAILISIVTGYVVAMAFGLVDFTAVSESHILGMPNFTFPIFNLTAILIIIPASLTVISEHIG
ncbi:MAG: solute carrier family 23 protein, partial [Eubacteriales bacterium]|nr:solute carrier family 23 protein [Eubacteriales bacterium]